MERALAQGIAPESPTTCADGSITRGGGVGLPCAHTGKACE